jgi:hypothetical protein
VEYHAQFLRGFFRLEIQPLKANDLSLDVFDQNDPMAHFLTDFLPLRIIPIDGEGFSYGVMDNFYVGYILSPSLTLSQG